VAKATCVPRARLNNPSSTKSGRHSPTKPTALSSGAPPPVKIT